MKRHCLYKENGKKNKEICQQKEKMQLTNIINHKKNKIKKSKPKRENV